MTSRAWAAFATVSVLWGIPYLFIKVAVDDGVPPGFVAWSRVLLGAAVLLAISWRAGILAPLRGRGRWLAVYAVLEIAIPFPLIGWRAARLLGAHRDPDRLGAAARGAAGTALRRR